MCEKSIEIAHRTMNKAYAATTAKIAGALFLVRVNVFSKVAYGRKRTGRTDEHVRQERRG